MRLFGLLCGLILVAVTFNVPAQAPGAHRELDIGEIRKLAAQSPDSAGPVDAGLRAPRTAEIDGPRDGLPLVTLRIVGYLLLVLLLIFGVAWGARKLGLAGKSAPGTGMMDILDVLSLGQNRSLMLVRVMDKVYLFAQSANQITGIETFEGEKALEIISSSKGGVSMVKFKDAFNSFVGRLRKQP